MVSNCGLRIDDFGNEPLQSPLPFLDFYFNLIVLLLGTAQAAAGGKTFIRHGDFFHQRTEQGFQNSAHDCLSCFEIDFNLTANA